MSSQISKNEIFESVILNLGHSDIADPSVRSTFDKLYVVTTNEIISSGKWSACLIKEEIKDEEQALYCKPLRVLYCNKANYAIAEVKCSTNECQYQVRKALNIRFSSEEYPLDIVYMVNIFSVCDNEPVPDHDKVFFTSPAYLQEVVIDKLTYKMAGSLGAGMQERSALYSKYEQSLRDARYLDSTMFYNLEKNNYSDIPYWESLVAFKERKKIERDKAIVERDKATEERDKAIVERDKAIVERDKSYDTLKAARIKEDTANRYFDKRMREALGVKKEIEELREKIAKLKNDNTNEINLANERHKNDLALERERFENLMTYGDERAEGQRDLDKLNKELDEINMKFKESQNEKEELERKLNAADAVINKEKIAQELMVNNTKAITILRKKEEKEKEIVQEKNNNMANQIKLYEVQVTELKTSHDEKDKKIEELTNATVNLRNTIESLKKDLKASVGKPKDIREVIPEKTEEEKKKDREESIKSFDNPYRELEDFEVQEVQEGQEIDGTCQKEKVDIIKSFKEQHRKNIQSLKDMESQGLEKLFKEKKERMEYLEKVSKKEKRIIDFIESSAQNLEVQKRGEEMGEDRGDVVKKVENNIKNAEKALLVVKNLIEGLKNEEEITIVENLIEAFENEKETIEFIESFHR